MTARSGRWSIVPMALGLCLALCVCSGNTRPELSEHQERAWQDLRRKLQLLDANNLEEECTSRTASHRRICDDIEAAITTLADVSHPYVERIVTRATETCSRHGDHWIERCLAVATSGFEGVWGNDEPDPVILDCVQAGAVLDWPESRFSSPEIKRDSITDYHHACRFELHMALANAHLKRREQGGCNKADMILNDRSMPLTTYYDGDRDVLALRVKHKQMCLKSYFREKPD